MNLNYKSVKTDREWKAVVGLSEDKFLYLVKIYKQVYEEIEGISLQDGLKNLNQVKNILADYESCLFFVLFQLKQGLTFDVLGFLLGTDSSNAKRNFDKYLSFLEKSLSKLNMLPERDFKDAKDFSNKLSRYIDSEKGILIDGTEHSTYRASNKESQKEMYSGKKKHIPIKKS